MRRPKIVEVDYYDFKAALQKAIDTGTRVEKGEARWAEYVKEEKINEVAMRAWGKSKFANALKPSLVIIDIGGSWGGFYAYSTADEIALKWKWVEQEA